MPDARKLAPLRLSLEVHKIQLPAVASMEKKAEADGLNPQQRAIVMARVRQNVVNSIERGQIPEVKVKESPLIYS